MNKINERSNDRFISEPIGNPLIDVLCCVVSFALCCTALGCLNVSCESAVVDVMSRAKNLEINGNNSHDA